jgi:hypothetical protein
MMHFTRRALLRTLAGTSFAATTLRRWEAWAQAGAFPTRLLILYSSAGLDLNSTCSGTGATYTLSPGFQPLAPFRNKLTVLDGVRIPDHVSEEHPDGRSSMLTGRRARNNSGGATGISIDKFIANALTNGRSLFCGPQGTRAGGGVDQPVSWQASGTPNDAYLEGLQALLNTVFSGTTTPPPMTGGGAAGGMSGAAGGSAGGSASTSAARAAVENELALNRHLQSELARLKRVAPASEREKLELHLLALQQLRAGIPPLPADGAGGGGATGAGGGAAGGSAQGGGSGTTTLPGCTRPSMTTPTEQDAVALAVAHAFACGRSRIAVVRIGGDEPIHTYSHWGNATVRAQLRAADLQNATHVARALGYLDAFAEGSGTVLSNTLVVWTTEVTGSYLSSPDIHGTIGVPFVLAGGMGGRFKVGQRLVVPNTRTNTELYRTIASAMGVPNAGGFGDASFGGASLPDVLV